METDSNCLIVALLSVNFNNSYYFYCKEQMFNVGLDDLKKFKLIETNFWGISAIKVSKPYIQYTKNKVFREIKNYVGSVIQ